MEVRRIEDAEDVRGLIVAHNRAWREAYEGFLPETFLEELPTDPDEELVREWEQGLNENREGVLIAAAADTVLGFIDLRWGDAETKAFVGEGEADLKAIHVDPEYWNQGIGTALLEAGLELLPTSVEAVRLEVFAENDVAIPFYEAKGFERTGAGEYELAGSTYPTYIYTLAL